MPQKKGCNETESREGAHQRILRELAVVAESVSDIYASCACEWGGNHSDCTEKLLREERTVCHTKPTSKLRIIYNASAS